MMSGIQSFLLISKANAQGHTLVSYLNQCNCLLPSFSVSYLSACPIHHSQGYQLLGENKECTLFIPFRSPMSRHENICLNYCMHAISHLKNSMMASIGFRKSSKSLICNQVMKVVNHTPRQQSSWPLPPTGRFSCTELRNLLEHTSSRSL